MSHLKERKEKVCLNCNAAIYGKFCHICGQQNIEPQESFWHLTSHFIADILHYDGKFFSTLKYLLFKPGYLAKEHLRGRRADYLHPIRLYVFVSAIFFLIMFTFYTKKAKPQQKDNSFQAALHKLEKEKQNEKGDEIYLNGVLKINTSNDSAIHKIDSAITFLKADTTAINIALAIADLDTTGGYDLLNEYSTKEIYLDSQNKLLPEKRDSWFEKKKAIMEIAIQRKAKAEGVAASEIWEEVLTHNIPKILFVSLPLIAFIFYVFYNRNRKLTFVNHFVFTVYIFCFLFLSFLILRLGVSFLNAIHFTIVRRILAIVYFLGTTLYLYKSFRNFYGQSRTKTILKLVLLFFPFCIIFLIMTVLLFLATAFTV